MKFDTYISCGILGEELPASVYFDYEPAEEAVLYPIDDAYPGCAESADIHSIVVSINGYAVEVLPLIDEIDLGELEEECLEAYNDGSTT